MIIRERATLGYRGMQVLGYLRDTIGTRGTPPSYATIRDELGFCDEAAVSRCVQVLSRRGYIRLADHARGRPRIRLLNNKSNAG